MMVIEPPARCDPSPAPLTDVTLEGAHMVSEGAYFRFWIFNNNSFPITVYVKGAGVLSVPPKSWVDYDVTAPQISTPFERVTYTFEFSADGQAQVVDFPVMVLNSNFLQIFELAVPILIAVAAIIVSTVAVVLAKRRGSRIDFQVFLGALLIVTGIEVVSIFASGVLDQPLQLRNARYSLTGFYIEFILSSFLILLGIIILILWWISSHKPTESHK